MGGRQAGLAACPVPTPPGSTKQRRLLRLVRVGQPLLEDAHDFVHAVHDELPALIDLRQNGSIIFSRTVHFRRLVRGCIKTRLEEKRPIRPQKNASPRFFLPAKHRLRELLKRTRIVKEVRTCAFTLAWWPSRSAARRASSVARTVAGVIGASVALVDAPDPG